MADLHGRGKLVLVSSGPKLGVAGSADELRAFNNLQPSVSVILGGNQT